MSRPNILLIMSDDHAAHSLGALGNTVVQTPHLDNLAAAGALFSSHYCQSPMCTPARQSLLTSRMPHRVGVPFLTSSMPDGTPTLATHAQRHGYRTLAIGKTHFNSSFLYGFEHAVDRRDYQQMLSSSGVTLHDAFPAGLPWRPFEDPAETWLNAAGASTLLPYSESEAHFLASNANELFKTAGTDPFFLMLSFYEPHSPFVFPVDAQHRYNADEIELPPTSEQERRETPQIFSELTQDHARSITAAYYASVSHLDRAIGETLAGLDDAGLERDTIVAYCPDHGYLLGHHARFEKHCMYDEALHVPFILRWPGHVGEGRIVDGLTRSLDVAPTICELAGMEPMEEAEGSSVARAATGTHAPLPEHASAVYLHTETAMVRTATEKLVVATGEADDWYRPADGVRLPTLEHFDLRADPSEHVSARLADGDAGQVTNLLSLLAADLGVKPSQSGQVMLDGIRGLLRSYRDPNEPTAGS